MNRRQILKLTTLLGACALAAPAALAISPPAEMVKRDPMAAKWANGMPGGPTNPLGARALYLFQGKVDTLYRIHGTADPRSIGRAVSSGCIRLLNVDVADLYERVTPGARVVVLQGKSRQPERLAKPAKP